MVNEPRCGSNCKAQRKVPVRMLDGSGHAVRSEKQLLLYCARTCLDPYSAGRIRALAGGKLDWPYLLELAAEHCVLPLLYSKFKAVCSDKVPPQWTEQLLEAFQQNTRRNLFLTAELLRILEAFRANGITAIPYKGPVLAEQAYGNLAYRQFADLDIVIRQRDVARAYELLTAQGYRSEVNARTVGQAAQGKIPGQYLFVGDARRSIVELHTEATLRYFPTPPDLEALSRRTEAVSVASREVLTFSGEDALPILCVHGSKHFWERLLWICDIAQLAHIPRGLDWEVALEQARRLGAERMTLLGLHLANGLLGAAVPDPILRRVQEDRVVRSLAAQVCRKFFRESSAAPGATQRFLFRARMRGNLWEGLGYVFRLATAPTEEDWSQVQLMGPLSPLYGVLRPFRLLRKYGTGWARDPAAGPAGSARVEDVHES